MSEELVDITTEAPANPEIDSIWLTKPSIKPIVLAVSFLLALIGLYAFRPLMYVAILVALIVTIAWAFDNRDESDELPLG
jgi:hypothetical protein